MKSITEGTIGGVCLSSLVHCFSLFSARHGWCLRQASYGGTSVHIMANKETECPDRVRFMGTAEIEVLGLQENTSANTQDFSCPLAVIAADLSITMRTFQTFF